MVFVSIMSSPSRYFPSLTFFLASAGWSFVPELMAVGVLRNAVAGGPGVLPLLLLHRGLS